MPQIQSARNVVNDKSPTFYLDIEARCRRCGSCMKARGALWRGRAKAEFQNSSRTWFGTLTLTPAWQFKALSTARSAAAKAGEDFDALPEEKQFKARCLIIGREVTLYLKRLRKQSGAKIRYLLVFERHKSGDPHMHILVHERGMPVRHKLLTDQWRIGFSKFNLVTDAAAASYVCKYISKSAIARVRASEHYGDSFKYDVKYLSDLSHSSMREKYDLLFKPRLEGVSHNECVASSLQTISTIAEPVPGTGLSKEHGDECGSLTSKRSFVSHDAQIGEPDPPDPPGYKPRF